MTFGQRMARITTDAVVRRPALWQLFRPLMRRQFERLAPMWDEMRANDAFLPLHAALEALPAPPATALDVGTGTGSAARLIVERFPEADVTGVDLAPKMVELARAKVPRARFEVVDAQRLPFADGTFDLVTLANMIPFFDEIARVTASAGHVVVSFSRGAKTPIYVPPETLRRELGSRGFADFADFSAGSGTALLARKR